MAMTTNILTENGTIGFWLCFGPNRDPYPAGDLASDYIGFCF